MRHRWSVAGLVIAGSSAFALAVHARALAAERAHPPAGRFVEADGVRLHLIERGQGEPVVLLHGNGSVAEEVIKSEFATLAARQFRVIAFDRPGYGYSERPHDRIWTPAEQADLLLSALRKLGIGRAILFGHSWGALVAVAAALRHPDAVRGLVLESGYYYPTPRPDILLSTLSAIPVIGDGLRYTVSPLAARALWPMMRRRLFSPAPVSPSFLRFPIALALRPSQLRTSAAEAALMIPAAAALQCHYGAVTPPVAVVAGIGDRMVDAETQSGRLSSVIRHSSMHFVGRCGHMVHYTAPQRVLAALWEVARSI